VYDYSDLGRKPLAEALERARLVFGRAGVEVGFEDCSQARLGHNDPEGCFAPLGSHLLLKVLLRRQAPRPVSVGSQGYSLVPVNGEPGVLAGVFREGLDALTRGSAASPPQILGHVAAHEIGHLLLGSEAHAVDGLMAAHWSPEDLEAAARGQLVFSPEQARRLRLGASTRARRALPPLLGMQ
jgi:hypothetical protein